jgi:glycosyltransferase involved in cell wall biosynthesis
MRVLRISHASLTPALRERERALVRGHADVELEVVTTSRWREAEVVVNAVGDDLFPVTTSLPLFSKHIQLFAYDPRPIIAALRRHRPHLIDLNHEPYSVACAEVLTLCKWYAPQAAIVLQPCQNIFHRYPPPFNWLEQRALRRAAAAHVCSETVRELLRAKGFNKPVEIIPFGVDVRSFQFREPTCEPKEALTIGFVGRMLPAKGLTILAGALAQLRSEKWNLLIVGDGPERQNFESTLSANGLLDRARFTGAISFDQVPDLFQRMDMLVLPTQTTARIREQFGRVLVEAMASGVPVIGSTCGAIPEVIDRVGLVTPEGDVRELAKAIGKLLANPALRAEFARAGKVRAEQHYSWDRVADKTYEFFQEVLTTNAAPSSSIEQTLEFAS